MILVLLLLAPGVVELEVMAIVVVNLHLYEVFPCRLIKEADLGGVVELLVRELRAHQRRNASAAVAAGYLSKF